ncbi:hypothetical protein F511_30972 [Dorcoceras hygrometricum]|uniref:K Homology domain-containing protein n=1 Tax=Dorcoceras hygrometricum TaxID=472368 RepID=A0A2Z7D183_9LAMI|nr:hypothetical protein F511_30972 [Dorcoceras hygrometricum]
MADAEEVLNGGGDELESQRPRLEPNVTEPDGLGNSNFTALFGCTGLALMGGIGNLTSSLQNGYQEEEKCGELKDEEIEQSDTVMDIGELVLDSHEPVKETLEIITEEPASNEVAEADNPEEPDQSKAEIEESSKELPDEINVPSNELQSVFGTRIISRQMEVGVLIGKAGHTIHSLQDNSGTKIQIMKDAKADPQYTGRVSGNKKHIETATDLMKDVMNQGNYGQEGPDCSLPPPYSQTPAQPYGHGYNEVKNNHHSAQQHSGHMGPQQTLYARGGTQSGYGPQDQYGKPPMYVMPPQGTHAQQYGQPRPSQPGVMPHQGCDGVCIMSTTWKEEQHPSFINFISCFLSENSCRLNFVSIDPDFIFNCGGVSTAFIFVTNWDSTDNTSIFSRAKKLMGQFANLYLVVTLPTWDQNDSFVRSYFKSGMELGRPAFMPVKDLEMGFEKIVKVALARGACKRQDVMAKLRAEREISVQSVDLYVKVVTSVPGIDNHDANALNQAIGSIEAIARAPKEYIMDNTDLSAEKAELIARPDLSIRGVLSETLLTSSNQYLWLHITKRRTCRLSSFLKDRYPDLSIFRRDRSHGSNSLAGKNSILSFGAPSGPRRTNHQTLVEEIRKLRDEISHLKGGSTVPPPPPPVREVPISREVLVAKLPQHFKFPNVGSTMNGGSRRTLVPILEWITSNKVKEAGRKTRGLPTELRPIVARTRNPRWEQHSPQPRGFTHMISGRPTDGDSNRARKAICRRMKNMEMTPIDVIEFFPTIELQPHRTITSGYRETSCLEIVLPSYIVKLVTPRDLEAS